MKSACMLPTYLYDQFIMAFLIVYRHKQECVHQGVFYSGSGKSWPFTFMKTIVTSSQASSVSAGHE